MKLHCRAAALAVILLVSSSLPALAQSASTDEGAGTAELASGPVAEWMGDWWVEASGYGAQGTLSLGTRTNLWTSLPTEERLSFISRAMTVLMNHFPNRHIYTAEIVGTGRRPEEGLWFRMTYDVDADVTTFTPPLE